MGLIASVRVEGISGHAQRIRAGSHELASDEPRGSGGTDLGPSPYGLVLSGLGACTSITLRMYAERKGWDVGVIRVHLRHFKEARGEHIEREISFSGPLEPEKTRRLLEIAEKTPVTLTLKTGIAISTKLAP